MKRIDELTRDELAALTDEQTAQLIELEIAYAGILPVPEPTYEEVPTVDIKKSDVGYEAHGVTVRKREDAETIARIEACGWSYDSPTGYNYKYLTEPNAGEVKTVYFYDRDEVQRTAARLKEKDRIEGRNEAKREEYKKFVEKTTAIREHARGLVYEAREFAGEVEYAKTVFKRHLELAEGNYGIAVNFFKKAYEGKDEIVAKVLDNYGLVKNAKEIEEKPAGQPA